MHGDNGRTTIDVKMGDCRLRVDMKGSIDFLPDESGVARMPRGAYLNIEERFRGVKRSIEFRPGAAGKPEIQWEVDGERQAFDAEAQEWLSFMLPQLFRMTGLDAEKRVGRFLARGGPQAVLDEIVLIGGDYVQRRYFIELMKQADLDSATMRAWVELAGKEIGSDYELAETLSKLPAASLSEAALQESFVEATLSIDSDYEMRRTLNNLLKQKAVSSDILDPILRAALEIGSDYECAELLIAVAQHYPGDEALPKSYFDAAATIGSDYEMRRAFAKAVERPMNDETIAALLLSAREIGSDYELAQLLVELVKEHGIPDSLEREFRSTLDTVGSKYEHGRVTSEWYKATGD